MPDESTATKKESLESRFLRSRLGFFLQLRVGSCLLFLALLAVLFVGKTIAANPLPKGCDLHLWSQFAGVKGLAPQLQDAGDCTQLTLSQAHQSLGWDFGFAATYGALFAFTAWLWWRNWRSKRVRKLRYVVVFVGIGAALFDVLENILTLIGLTTHDFAKHQPPLHNAVTYHSDAMARAVSCAASLKWMLFVIAVLAAVVGFWASVAPHADDLPEVGEKPITKPKEQEDAERLDIREDLGICCSGGGIRAAAYALGALTELEQRKVVDEARWLAAVSGGAYTAAGWTLRRHAGDTDAAMNMIGHLLGKGSREYRYLSSGKGGLTRAAFSGILVILFNVVAIALFVVAVSAPIGRAVSTLAIRPAFKHGIPDVGQVHIAVHQWYPGVALIGIGLAIVCARGLFDAPGPHPLTTVGFAVMGVGAVQLAVFFVLPYTMALLDDLFTEKGSSIVVGVLSIGFVGAMLRVLTARLTKIASRLGGVLLALLLFVGGGWVAILAAQQSLWFWFWPACTIVFVVLFCFVPVQWASLRGLYRDGIRRAFTTGPGEAVTWWELRESDPKSADNLPELVLCAASQQKGLAPGGIPATSITISRSGVRAYSRRRAPNGVTEAADADIGYLVPTAEYVATVPMKYRRELQTVSGWIALSGAAFSSAMGRQGKGSTNALMAACNIDLGAWIPNPWQVRQGATNFKPIRLGYLAKEILGIYDFDDENVFVSDGGQWENLGLVELLRRECKTIICIDASGDKPDTFTTFAEALQLAASVLPFNIEITRDMNTLKGHDGQLPSTCTTEFEFKYVPLDGSPKRKGRLIYAKLQVANDQPRVISEYATRDRKFPNYPTSNQFLSYEQVTHLVLAGGEAGKQLVHRYRHPPKPN